MPQNIKPTNKGIMNNWKKQLRTKFGNGQKENETISGYLGDLFYSVNEIILNREKTQREEIVEMIDKKYTNLLMLIITEEGNIYKSVKQEIINSLNNLTKR